MVIAIAQAGCDSTRPNPEYCGGNGVCIDPALPFCDVDGSQGPAHTEDTCIAVTCTPGEFIACRGAETLSCNSTGDNFNVEMCEKGCTVGSASCTPCTPRETRCRDSIVEACTNDGVFVVAETCGLGCVDTATTEPHCAYLEPKYLSNICDEPSTANQITFQTSTYDTNLDMNCTGGIVPQNGGPEICVVRANAISIPQGATLTIAGTRALAFVGDASVDVEGTLDVGAIGALDGPGGGIGNNGTGGNIDSDAKGGGGGGFATPGGHGGSRAADGGAGNGGGSSPNPAILTALIGGSRGGGGVGGGGAGGALMLVACRGKVTIGGTVDASGGGAAPASVSSKVVNGISSFVGSPGFGGGSGGNIVIQGLQIDLHGRLFATGGGGGSGNENPFNMSAGTPGRDGGPDGGGAGGSTVRSNGGGGTGAGVGVTGAGALPSPGQAQTGGGSTTPGGGGGSVGFVQTYTPEGVTPTRAPTAQSPMLQPNLVVKTR
ncbi:MAG: hypothetical protein KIT31_16920 [Deltaproteobacteria bacterium]|nr:hypothetical protein [Deltaproteobacteria bacterium]